jgi:tetratricopeptide (TPR) repeat protein
MDTKIYPDTYSYTAKNRIDFVLEYREMKKDKSLSVEEIDKTLKKKYGMDISDLPSREAYMREFHDLYTRHCWCETNRILWTKYGMTITELATYYRYYPFYDQFTHKSFDKEHFQTISSARKYRLDNLKRPAILDGISENTSYTEFTLLLNTNRELCDYFHNLDAKRENEFIEIYTAIRKSDTDEARREARKYWLEYARDDFTEWEYRYKPCRDTVKLQIATEPEDLIILAECLHENDYPGLIRFLTSIITRDENYAETYYKRALAYIKTGDPLRAAEDLRKVLELNPNHAEAGKTLDTLKPSLP